MLSAATTLSPPLQPHSQRPPASNCQHIPHRRGLFSAIVYTKRSSKAHQCRIEHPAAIHPKVVMTLVLLSFGSEETAVLGGRVFIGGRCWKCGSLDGHCGLLGVLK